MKPRQLDKFLQEQRRRNISLLTNNYSLSHEDAEDVYQEACIALYRNFQEGKLQDMTAKLSTYFTKICINLALKHIRDRHNVESLDIDSFNPARVAEVLDMIDDNATTRQQQAMQNIINRLPWPCGIILWSYYYEEMSMTQIAPLVNYSGAQSVKAKKWSCISRLKSQFSNDLNDIYNGEND